MQLRPQDIWRRWLPLRRRVESKRVDEFAAMSDEELRAYVYGDKGQSSE